MRLFLFLIFLAQGVEPHHTIFVVDKIVQDAEAHNVFGGVAATAGEHHTAPIVMAEFAKKCPAITFTTEKSNADYILATQSGGTTVSNLNGAILYVSPAKKLHNMVKDVCKFVAPR